MKILFTSKDNITYDRAELEFVIWGEAENVDEIQEKLLNVVEKVEKGMFLSGK